MERKFKITPPIGNIVVGKEEMSESELRQFTLQQIADTDANEVWREKVEKDPIGDVVEWLKQNGYGVTEL